MINDIFFLLQELQAKAYCPYSKFPVACVITTNNTHYCSFNIENASYSLTICAERTALFAAVVAGDTNFQAVHLLGGYNSDVAVFPCGACRQTLAEFLISQTPIFIYNSKGIKQQTTLDKLLPSAFTKQNF